jgi:hypothetical protein
MIHRLILYVLLIVVVANSGFIAGYASKKQETEKEARCINSACEGKCKTKFVRHQGCEK